MDWVYKRGDGSFAEMTDLAKDFRARLAEVAEIRPAGDRDGAPLRRRHPKWLLRADASQAFEMVFIPETDRGTLCISSQVGCALDCSFCSTAQQGFNRNLTTAEIVGQVWLAVRELERDALARPAAAAGADQAQSCAMGATSPTSCSWAWANRLPISATWCRHCRSSWMTSVSTCRAAA